MDLVAGVNICCRAGGKKPDVTRCWAGSYELSKGMLHASGGAGAAARSETLRSDRTLGVRGPPRFVGGRVRPTVGLENGSEITDCSGKKERSGL